MDPDASSTAVRASAQCVGDRAAPPILARESTGGQPSGNARRVRSSAAAWNPFGVASAAPDGGRRDHRALPRGRAWCGENLSLARASGTNGRRGAASVMRCSCRRGETFEGYSAGGKRVNGRSLSGGHAGIEAKPSEPQVRYQAATCLEPTVWRKPSRWCETTRTEHDVVVAPRPEPWKRGGVDTRGHVGGGENPGEGESQGRKDPPEGGFGSAPGAPEVR